jgi:hypothetical protein
MFLTPRHVQYLVQIRHSNVEDKERMAGRIDERLHRAAERLAIQPPQARHKKTSKNNDLAREAVNWNGLLARATC